MGTKGLTKMHLVWKQECQVPYVLPQGGACLGETTTLDVTHWWRVTHVLQLTGVAGLAELDSAAEAWASWTSTHADSK